MKKQEVMESHIKKNVLLLANDLLEKNDYSLSPFPPRKQLPVAKESFDRCMEIFIKTTDTLCAGATGK